MQVLATHFQVFQWQYVHAERKVTEPQYINNNVMWNGVKVRQEVGRLETAQRGRAVHDTERQLACSTTQTTNSHAHALRMWYE